MDGGEKCREVTKEKMKRRESAAKGAGRKVSGRQEEEMDESKGRRK